MRAVWPGFKFRVGLCGDEPGMIRNLNHLDDPSVRGDAGQLHTVFRQGLAVIVVDLIAVAVTFVDRFLSVQPIGFGGFVQDAGIRTETQGSADILDVVLVRHQMNDRGRQMPDPEKHHQGTCGNRSKLTFVMQLFLL